MSEPVARTGRHVCVKRHDVRKLRKRDVPLRGQRVEVVQDIRRFWCLRCHRAFTEPDQACGRGKHTTWRLREVIGKLASSRPITHVAREYGVGPRLVQGCVQTLASCLLATRGLSVEEGKPRPPPRFLGIDEFARRKGHRDVPILCDLEARQVLEVSAGRKQEEVVRLLERLDLLRCSRSGEHGYERDVSLEPSSCACRGRASWPIIFM